MGQLAFRTMGFFVEDVPATLDFYHRAFGMKARYLHPSGGYGELETGDTLLTFLSRQFIEDTDLLGGAQVVLARDSGPLIGAQVAFVTADINVDWHRAVEARATILKSPEPKPWGQTAGYLLDMNGAIVEICTPSLRV
jgi:lactoylglutathione lyase